MNQSQKRTGTVLNLSSILPPMLADVRARMRQGETVSPEALRAALRTMTPMEAPAFLDGADLEAAWQQLARDGHNPESQCETCGQGWQYMGPDSRSGGQSFRHRCGKGCNQRLYVTVKPAPVACDVVEQMEKALDGMCRSCGCSTEVDGVPLCLACRDQETLEAMWETGREDF